MVTVITSVLTISVLTMVLFHHGAVSPCLSHHLYNWPPFYCPSILFQVVQFLCRRENSMHQSSVLLRTGLQQTYLWTNSGSLWSSLCKGRMSPAVLAQVWRLKSGSLLLISLVTDASIVNEHCWLCEGKATQQIKQQIENRSDNCLLGKIK